MFDQFSDGYCQECLLKNEMRDMILDDHDFWECPVCHLQARSARGHFVLLRTRGEGRLKSTKATEHIVGCFICRAEPEDQFKTGSWFNNESELREFLATVADEKESVMKNKKTKTAKRTYLKGHEPRTVHLKEIDRTFTTNGLTKQEWDSVKKKFEKMPPKDIKMAKDLLSI
jgi:hypothetical protein